MGFSRRETNGLLILFPLIIFFLFSRSIVELFSNDTPPDFSRERIMLDSLVGSWEIEPAVSSAGSIAMANSKRLFLFDPNTSSTEELCQLGFSPRIASRIVNYRNSGGVFHQKNDLLRVYGMDTLRYETLYNYIQLPEKPEKQALKYTETVKALIIASEFDINEADSTNLIAVKGIGPVLAQRIIKYRNRLGGFYNTMQLYEIFGLDSAAVVELMKVSHVDSFPIKKININKADEKELSLHPYISKSMAKNIVAYRFQHGVFVSVEDIRNIRTLNNEVIGKLLPYLSTGD